MRYYLKILLRKRMPKKNNQAGKLPGRGRGRPRKFPRVEATNVATAGAVAASSSQNATQQPSRENSTSSTSEGRCADGSQASTDEIASTKPTITIISPVEQILSDEDDVPLAPLVRRDPPIVYTILDNVQDIDYHDDNETRNNDRPIEDSRHDSVTMPTELKNMRNDLQVATWLSRHPTILDLAQRMYQAEQTQSFDTQGTSTIIPQVIQAPLAVHHDSGSSFVLMEEAKVLFLRTRINTKALYEELVSRVSHVPKGDGRSHTCVQRLGHWYNDYRCELRKSLQEKANEWLRLNSRRRLPTNDEAKAFITTQVAECIMALHIDATKDRSLHNCPTMQQKLSSVIQLLFCDAVDALLKGKKVAKILRNHNDDTVDLQFPSKHGIATTMPVRELLRIKRPNKNRTINQQEDDCEDD